MRTLEQFLRDERAEGKNHFMFRVEERFGQLKLVVFPAYSAGGIMDFELNGDTLKTVAEQFSGHDGNASACGR